MKEHEAIEYLESLEKGQYMTVNILTRAISTTCQSLLVIYSAVSVFYIFRDFIIFF